MNLSDEDKKYFLSLKPEDITFDLLDKLFANHLNAKAKYEFQDEMTLKKGEYFNDSEVLTNLGLFILNKAIIEKDLSNVTGYVNWEMTEGGKKKLDKIIDKALQNDVITYKEKIAFLDNWEWLSMRMNSIITVSFSSKMMVPLKSVKNAKLKLFKDKAKELEANPGIVGAQIEKELVTMAKKELEGDPAMFLYDSGARGSFSNNYKNLNIMKGPVLNPSKGKYDVVKNAFMDGISKEDFEAMGTSVVSGAYPKAVGTAVSGYFTKQILAALQAVMVDYNIDDCGSKGTLNVLITEKNANDYLFNYIVEGGKTILLTDENISKYYGRVVKKRSPMYCINPKLCRKCCGDRFKKLEIENVGLTAAKISSTLLNLGMKKFHNSTISLYEVKPGDVDRLFI